MNVCEGRGRRLPSRPGLRLPGDAWPARRRQHVPVRPRRRPHADREGPRRGVEADVRRVPQAARRAYGRVGPAVADRSIPDAITIIGAVAAVPHVPWRDQRLRLLMGLFGFYLAAVGVSVVASPSSTAAAEIFHRSLMVFGALMIGSAL